MADTNMGSVPEDSNLNKTLVSTPTKADPKRGEVASIPDNSVGAPDQELSKVPDISKIEADIEKNFFKGPKKSIDAAAAELINTKHNATLSAYRQFLTTNKSASSSTTRPGVAAAPNVNGTKTRADRIADAMQLAAARATVDLNRFHHAYSLPYMKRSLALAYDRTQMMRAQVKLMDKTRMQILAKLESIKLNTAAPEAAKTTFTRKVLEETQRQSIARLAASIQDLGFQYANRAYTASVSKPINALRNRMANGEKLSGITRSATLRGIERLNRMKSRDTSHEGIAKYFTEFKNGMVRAGVGLGSMVPAKSRVVDAIGDVAYPLVDVASKYNPFNKSVFNPMAATSATGETFVSADGSTQSLSSASSPLFKAFTAWVREYRVDQHELQAILLGKKTTVSPIRGGDPERDALKSFADSMKDSVSTPGRNGILSALVSAAKDLRGRYKARHVNLGAKATDVKDKVTNHFTSSTLREDISSITNRLKRKTKNGASAEEIIDTLKDVKDPGQLRQILKDLGPKALAVLKSPEAKRIAAVAAAGNVALLAYLGLKDHVDTGRLWKQTRVRSRMMRRSASRHWDSLRASMSSTDDASTEDDTASGTDDVTTHQASSILNELSSITDKIQLKARWDKLSPKLKSRIKALRPDAKTMAKVGTNLGLAAILGTGVVKAMSSRSGNTSSTPTMDRRKRKRLDRKAREAKKVRARNGTSTILDHAQDLYENLDLDKAALGVAGLALGPIGTGAYRFARSKMSGKSTVKSAYASAQGALRGNRRRKFIKKHGQSTFNYFEQLGDFVNDPSIRNLIPKAMLKRIDNGEPVISVLPKNLRTRIIKEATRRRHQIEDAVPGFLDSTINRGSSFIERHLGAAAGAATRESLQALRDRSGSLLGSVSENLKTVTDQMGVGSDDNIFRRYAKGLEDVNRSVSNGGRIFKSLVGLGLHKLGVPMNDDRVAEYKGTLIGRGVSKLGYGLLDHFYKKDVLAQARIKTPGRKAYESVRNVIYHPTDLTNHEMALKRREDRRTRKAQRAKDKQEAADRKAKRKADDEAYYERQRQKRIANDAKSRKLRRGGKPTMMELLLNRMLGQKTDRLNSYADQIKKNHARKNAWYTWRRALGPKSKDDQYRYRDHYGLLGGAADIFQGFAGSMMGKAAGSALSLGWGATKLAGRGLGMIGHLGYRAVKGHALAGAVSASKGALPFIGRMAGTLGRVAMGPIGIGLAAHEIDKGINENLTGGTRRLADTAAKAVEYGAMGAMFGGPVGAAIGAGVGALIANSDYAAKALSGIGHVVATAVKPIGWGLEGLGKGLWATTKFFANTTGSLFTTIFGRSAKVDKNGHVIRQHKASLLEDFRIAFFGRKEVRTRTGEIAVTGRNSIFGDVKYGFQKLLFGDKFSNGMYKPGTSLIAELGSGMKHAFVSTFNAIKSLPNLLMSMISNAWSKTKSTVSDAYNSVKNKVVGGYNAIKNATSNAYDSVKQSFVNKKKRLTDTLHFIKDHPLDAMLAVGRSAFNYASTESLPIGMAVHTVGAFRAAGAWFLQSRAAKDPTTPLYQLITASLRGYGVSDRDMYDYLHTLETYQKQISDHKVKPYNAEDMAWMCGKFGLDPKNTDCVNYFTTWYNQRFVPIYSLIANILKGYKLDTDSVMGAPKEVLAKIVIDINKALDSFLDASISSLVPTKDGYKKFANKGAGAPSTGTPSSITPPKPYDPKSPENITKTANAANTDRAAGYGGIPNNEIPTSNGDSNSSGRATPALAKGNVTDQPEYKAAFAKLPGAIQNEVTKNKSLQFVLWSSAVQHGPDAAAKMFATEYHPGTTTKNFIKDIYQSRSLKFVGNSSDESISAMQQLGKEQSFALQMDNGSIDPSLQDMGNTIGKPILGLGDGQMSIPTAPLTGTVKSRAADAVNYLMSKYKLPAFKADALVGNFIQESKLDYTNTSGDGGHAHGIAQWHGDRRAAIQKRFGKPVEAMDLHGQLDAVMWEMSPQGPEAAGGNQFRNATNVHQAIDALVNGYERPADRAGNVTVRTALANQVGKDLGNLNADGSTPQAGGASVVAAPDIAPASGSKAPIVQTASLSMDKASHSTMQSHTDAMQTHADAMNNLAKTMQASVKADNTATPASSSTVVNSTPIVVANLGNQGGASQSISVQKHSVTTGMASS